MCGKESGLDSLSRGASQTMYMNNIKLVTPAARMIVFYAL